MRQISLFDDFVTDEREDKTIRTDWLLIDGNNLLNRAFYATANNKFTAPDGTPTNAVSLFLRMALNYQKQFNTNIVVFFDKGKGFRKKLYPEYKEGRNETPELLERQFPVIREVLTSAGIPYFWNDDLEADDLIGAACNSLSGHKYILSNDKDLLQLIRNDVTVVVRRKNNEDILMTPHQFSLEWDELIPQQIVDIKSLAGDTSDNIKGVPGVGNKGALKIIKHFGCVEKIEMPFPKEIKRYEKKFDDNGMKEALFAKQLTTLKVDTPLQIKEYEINESGLIKICEKLAMKSIIDLIMYY
ncbi:5'-3' exonuclease [Lysinibacillus sp. UGB7]|uniref:5'-3' exonuclease n=1 Tax=Lysinibacillus sp. UGB7 TaxID=3411039 RepID=UPI003B7D7973